MSKIGIVVLPSEWRVERANESVQIRVFDVRLTSTYNTIELDGVDLPVIRYSGFCQTTDDEALNVLDALVDQFKNPDISDIYINADEQFYFYLQNFSYRKMGGRKNYWTFDLGVYRIGSVDDKKLTYNTSEIGRIDNEFDI